MRLPRACAISVAICLLSFSLAFAAEPIPSLPRLKDPTVLAFGDDAETSPSAHLMIAMELFGSLHGYWMEGQFVTGEVRVEMPDSHGHVRWGPALFRDGNTVYLYSGRGKPFDWPTYRIAVVRADLATDCQWTPDRRLESIRFHDEIILDVMSDGKFRQWDDAGLIDPEMVRIDGRLDMLFVAVLHGIENVRGHEEFICRVPMTSPTEPVAGTMPQVLYDGAVGPKDDGIAEAPTVLRDGAGLVLIYSSYGSDRDQRIAALRYDNTQWQGTPARRILYAVHANLDSWKIASAPFEIGGVGGQTAMLIEGRPWLLYQGLGEDKPGATFEFRLGLLDLDGLLDR